MLKERKAIETDLVIEDGAQGHMIDAGQGHVKDAGQGRMKGVGRGQETDIGGHLVNIKTGPDHAVETEEGEAGLILTLNQS